MILITMRRRLSRTWLYDYESPGAIQSVFYLYAAFELDASQNEEWLKTRGKAQVRNLILTGADHALSAGAENMANQVFERPHLRFVAESRHYMRKRIHKIS